MPAEQVGYVARVVHDSYDIEMPELAGWNDRPCPRHAGQDAPEATCRLCGVRPRRHQRVGITWMYLMRYSGLFDSTGLGKTVQCAGLLALLKDSGELGMSSPGRRALIICRAATIGQWVRELGRMVPDMRTLAVTGDRRERAAKLGMAWEVALCGPEMIVSKVARGFEQLAEFDIGTVICDDIEALKNPNKTSRTIKHITDNADRVVIATATPLDKRLTQLYDLGTQFLGWGSVLGSREEFVHRYVQMEQEWYTPRLKPTVCRFCKETMLPDHPNKEWVHAKTKRTGPCPARAGLADPRHFPVSKVTPGVRFTWAEKGANPINVAELQGRVSQMILRRTAADCDDVNMPDVQLAEEWLELGAEQAKRYEEVRRGILTRLDTEGRKISQRDAENLWLRAWQITSGLANLDGSRSGESVKLDWVVNTLTGDLADEPVVVYCYFRATLADLAARLERAGVKTVRIWGEQHAAEQDGAIRMFNEGTVRVMLITDAGGSGLNLQTSRRLIMVDTPRSVGRVVQVIGREKRDASAHETVYVTRLFTQTPIEYALSEMITAEAVMSDQVLGEGEISFTPVEAAGLLRMVTG